MSASANEGVAMSSIETVPESDATGRRADLYAEDREEYGFVPDHTRVMTVNLGAYEAWENLISAIARPMGLRRYELVTLAAARGAGSRHCRLAHGRKSISLFGEDQLLRIAHDYRDAGLSGAEVAMMEYAERISRDAGSITDADLDVLRGHGFTDRDIVDIALAAAARNFYSRAIQALAAEVEDLPGLSPALARALTENLAPTTP
ncbi:carboxymuconolactone decarboxylase family protein [Amnibacterium flavum]|uniref:Carboxymuconolactone decarboxylase n=1 Tax=Amnibacterium flavum TaxID=2173173 RepID=A0A2V1HTY7_9MICO|nr:carboxymuconolactone decarboxylase family protein [Amnibacterium flavum]PVZ94509.1 carboxymuconolactone decarboxylase [Amnibacterium flavum]